MNDINTRRLDGTQRVVVTGVGAVTPAGVGIEALWDALLAKRCAISEITAFDTTDFEVHIGGEVKDFDGQAHGLTKKEVRRFERFVQFAVVAADEAIADAALDFSQEDLTRIGCIVGSGIGGINELQEGFHTLETKGPKRVNPLLIPTMIINMAPGTLSLRYGLRAECLSVVTACATGAHSIGEAVRSIRHGYADVILAGGTEEAITPIDIAGFTNLSALSKSNDPTQASLPFDRRRTGFVAGEGAGILVLESLEHALRRGAPIIAEIVGYGSTADAYHSTAPDPTGEGLLRAMSQALSEGGYTPDDLSHLNAHGTATPANDLTEARALLRLCGDERGSQVPVVAVKGVTGHMLGGTGAVEAGICALSVARSIVPPTTGFAEPDPECPVNVLTAPLYDVPQKVAISNSLGFGGHNAVLAFAPYPPLSERD